MLPCIAAVAIAAFVGKKTLEADSYGANFLLVQNVEALANSDYYVSNEKGCKTNSTIVLRSEKCVHGYGYGYSGTKYWCSEGDDTECKEGYDGTYAMCQGERNHPVMQEEPAKRNCK